MGCDLCQPVARVFDGNDHAVAVRFDDDRHRTAARRMPDGIRKQVQQDSFDLLGSDAHARVGAVQPGLEPHVASLRVGSQGEDATRDQVPKRNVAELEREDAGVDSREVEQVLDEQRQDPKLLPDLRQVFARCREAVLERFDHRLQRGQRRPQVVARPGDELAPRVEEPLDVRPHLVEGRAHLEQLPRPGFESAGGQVSGCELRRSSAQPLERPQDAARKQCGADERRQRRGERHRSDLDVRVHPEHHPARREHDGEREAHRAEHERSELQAQRRQQPERGRATDPRDEDDETEYERDADHARRR